MRIGSLASVSVIVQDPAIGRHLFREGLGLSFEGGEGDYVFTEKLTGVRHFGLWPLNEAAKACFGTDEWPTATLVPQASVEFEVDSVDAVGLAAEELRNHGFSLLHDAKEEPWGQTITRLLGDNGLLIGVCYTPWFH